DLSQLVFFPHPVAERMATKDELARIRYELEEIAAKTSTKGPRHSRAGAPVASTLQRAAARRSSVTRGTRSCANFCVREQYVAVPSRICTILKVDIGFDAPRGGRIPKAIGCAPADAGGACAVASECATPDRPSPVWLGNSQRPLPNRHARRMAA